MPFEVNFLCTRLGTKVTLKRLDVTKIVNSLQVSFQIEFNSKVCVANLALVSGAISAMNSCQMSTQMALLCELSAANATLVSGAISAMNSSKM